VAIPDGVTVKHAAGTLSVQGPRGTLSWQPPAAIRIEVADKRVSFQRPDDRKPTKALHGLVRARVANMLRGVTEGFRRDLEIQGVGYRADLEGKKLRLAVGFSHPVEMPVPEGLKVSVEKNTLIHVEGSDRETVGQFAADVRAVRPPEPYKGKGIRYVHEYVRRKVGKAGAA
jgi:large subunit ribosomal protein L6